VQPDDTPVTEYVMVAEGLAVTLEPDVELSALFGDQEYVVAPEAFNVVEPPAQIVGEVADAVTVGVIFTVKTTVCVTLHPAVVPVTEYVSVVAGSAVTTEPVVALRPVAGVHV
jgi:hypothetical protein